MWTSKQINKKIEVGKVLFYHDNGLWFAVYKPLENSGLVQSVGSKSKDDLEGWKNNIVRDYANYREGSYD